MPYLKQSLELWDTPAFNKAFRTEVLSLDPETLIPYLATTQGGYISPKQIDLGILSTKEDQKFITVKANFFYIEIVGGCNCDDDPFEVNGYCILLINIDKDTSSCTFALVSDNLK